MLIDQINANLAQIRHFQLHSELLPHVGQHYDEYRILLIGESHYLPTDDEINYENHEDVFRNWYEDKLEHIPGVPDEYWEEDRCWFNTRGIIADFLNGGQCDNEFLTTPNKLFDEVMREKKMVPQTYNLFNYCAFFNYFQRPHLREKKGFSSLCPDESKKTYNIVKAVINILEPILVLFVSTKASDNYVRNKYGSYENRPANVFCHLYDRDICDNGKKVPEKEYQEHLFGHPLHGWLNREEFKRVLSEYLKNF